MQLLLMRGLILYNQHRYNINPNNNALLIYMVRVTVAGCPLRDGCCRCRSLRTPGNILVANLALSDFFMLAKTPVFIFNSFNLGPALGKTGKLTNIAILTAKHYKSMGWIKTKKHTLITRCFSF